MSKHRPVREAQYVKRLAPDRFLGHKSVKTTMIYTHVLHRGGQGVQNPVDLL